MTERSPKESSTRVLEEREPRKRVGSQLIVSNESWSNLKQERAIPKGECLGDIQAREPRSGWDVKRLTKKTLPYSFEERLSKLREVWMGWVNNYRLASIYTKLKTLDEWLRNRLRSCIWSRY